MLHDEAKAVTMLLEAGAWRVHIRKPGVEEEAVARLLEEIPEGLRGRLSLHDCHSLALRYGVGGVHLNSRSPEVPEGFTGLISRSCHSFEELSRYGDSCDYMFLSPVFDSISKQGYKSRFTLEEIRAYTGCSYEKIFALGGVTPDKIPLLAAAGFGGAAVLGYVWNVLLNGGGMDALLSRFIAFQSTK